MGVSEHGIEHEQPFEGCSQIDKRTNIDVIMRLNKNGVSASQPIAYRPDE